MCGCQPVERVTHRLHFIRRGRDLENFFDGADVGGAGLERLLSAQTAPNETAAIVINAQNGIEMMTSRFMQYAQKRGLDRMIIVNKIDLVSEAKAHERFGAYEREWLTRATILGSPSRASSCWVGSC